MLRGAGLRLRSTGGSYGERIEGADAFRLVRKRFGLDCRRPLGTTKFGVLRLLAYHPAKNWPGEGRNRA